jgi:peptidoglycan/LPS O-acetylase OafA/YrhL
MTPRTRKLAGTIVLLIFLSVYALIAMLVAVVLQVNASKTVELIYYVVAGLLWVLPAGALITWMQRPDGG